MEAEDKVTLKGQSGAQYEFEVYQWGTLLELTGGVYLVLRKLPAGNYSILYIGQTVDLSERFDNHQQAACFTRNGRTHVAVRVENSKEKRLATETDLIRNYQTSCSKR